MRWMQAYISLNLVAALSHGLVQDCSNSIANTLELLQSCTKPLYLFCLTDGLVQDCSNSIANALELLQSCTKPWCAFRWEVHFTLAALVTLLCLWQED